MKLVIALLVVGASAYALHRLALWAEGRGWIYYVRRKPSTSALGNAFLEVQSLVEPQKRELLEARTHDRVEEDEQGDPPEPGAG